jgi:cytochrome P450
MTAQLGSIADDPWHGANPLDPAFRNDPYPALCRLREEYPVEQTPFGMWRLSRYDDCLRMLREVRCGVRTSDGKIPGVDEDTLAGQRRFMLQQDPPTHTRLRKLVSKAFTPRAVESLRPGIERVVDECLARMADQGEADLIAGLALPVPSTVICEMMGVPLGDRESFTQWTAQATHGLAGPMAPPEVLSLAMQAGGKLAEYFQDLIAERRESLGDDLLSGLIRAEEEGDRLSYEELVSQAIGLLIAGFETTIGLIANGVRQLLLHPGELARLRAEPALIETAVEECLRYDGPIMLTVRIAHEDARFGDQVIRADDSVFVLLAAANRDPARFANPERFDVGRAPNPHIAFGGGTHFCLGTHLARLEAQLAIGRLVARFPKLELVSGEVQWGASLFRVPGRLDVTL